MRSAFSRGRGTTVRQALCDRWDVWDVRSGALTNPYTFDFSPCAALFTPARSRRLNGVDGVPLYL
jgi:hypothetical protein